MKQKIINTLIIALIFAAVFLPDMRIGSQTWKSCGGDAFLGETQTFDYGLFRFFDDTLYKDDQAIAELKEYKFRFIDDVIYVASFDGQYSGVYCSQLEQ